ncbi:MAG: ferritin-like domain-containing protein [Solirubrobacterales bacterium]|nr:ferritin-like domain-containing protein [Solirubrobacterales bacterium]
MTTKSERTGRRPSAIEKIAADPLSRRRFLAIGGGTASAALLAACGDDEESSGGSETSASTTESSTTTQEMKDKMASQFGEGDLGIVNYALTLEYLEAAFYDDVVKSGLFKGDDLALIEMIGMNEQEHVTALEGTAKQLGDVAPEPKAKFPLDDAQSVLELAATVENLGAAAYLGQAGAIEDPKILAAALSIHSVEGRHAAILNQLIGESFVPDGPFAKPADMDEVLKQVQPFIVS